MGERILLRFVQHLLFCYLPQVLVFGVVPRGCAGGAVVVCAACGEQCAENCDGCNFCFSAHGVLLHRPDAVVGYWGLAQARMISRDV